MKAAVVTSAILGLASAGALVPRECSESFDSSFEITVAQVSYQKRDIEVWPYTRHIFASIY